MPSGIGRGRSGEMQAGGKGGVMGKTGNIGWVAGCSNFEAGAMVANNCGATVTCVTARTITGDSERQTSGNAAGGSGDSNGTARAGGVGDGRAIGNAARGRATGDSGRGGHMTGAAGGTDRTAGNCGRGSFFIFIFYFLI